MRELYGTTAYRKDFLSLSAAEDGIGRLPALPALLLLAAEDGTGCPTPELLLALVDDGNGRSTVSAGFFGACPIASEADDLVRPAEPRGGHGIGLPDIQNN